MLKLKFLSKFVFLSSLFTTVSLVTIAGGLPLVLASATVGVIAVATLTGNNIHQQFHPFAASVSGRRTLFGLLCVALCIFLLAQGQPAHALFDGAKEAASSGIGTYIGAEESLSLINTITFGMWALAAVGGIAVIAGGAAQNIQVLIGGLVLFFGMAVLIGVLEFTDGLLFSS